MSDDDRIDRNLITCVMSWEQVARIATAAHRELEATRKELDRVNAELTRLRRDLLDLTDLNKSK